jgi:hypothetical protein
MPNPHLEVSQQNKVIAIHWGTVVRRVRALATVFCFGSNTMRDLQIKMKMIPVYKANAMIVLRHKLMKFFKTNFIARNSIRSPIALGLLLGLSCSNAPIAHAAGSNTTDLITIASISSDGTQVTECVNRFETTLIKIY